MGKKVQQTRGARLAISNFRQQHKRLFTWLVVVAIAVLGIAGYHYKNYLNKWSDKDYVAIERAVEDAMKNTGATEVKRYEECYYRAPEKYASIRLYCAVELIGFVPYENDEQAKAVANKFEAELRGIGSVNGDVSEVIQDPHDAYVPITIGFNEPLPQDQRCNLVIATGARGNKVGSLIQYKPAGDVIGLAFQCSHESREEYFPVTYRQGS